MHNPYLSPWSNPSQCLGSGGGCQYDYDHYHRYTRDAVRRPALPIGRCYDAATDHRLTEPNTRLAWRVDHTSLPVEPLDKREGYSPTPLSLSASFLTDE